MQKATISQHFSVMILVFAGILGTPQSQAQTMYRCGTVYQDRPCENGQQGKIIGVNRPADPANKPALDPVCTRRGEDAKKIIWSREGGASAEQLMAETGSAERRRLIADIYAIRGNSLDVRLAIESDCMAENNRIRQGGNLQQEESLGRLGAAERKMPTTGDMEKGVESKDLDTAARRKRAQCDAINVQLESNRSSQRNGGSSASMDSLNQQKYLLENALKSANCDGAQRAMQMQ